MQIDVSESVTVYGVVLKGRKDCCRKQTVSNLEVCCTKVHFWSGSCTLRTYIDLEIKFEEIKL